MTNEYGNLELHQVLLSAMKDIDRICRENGLRYYLHAGTLLGAMNHKGFIPWDDDVDISLFRGEYETLLEILQRDYRDRYFVQNYLTDEEYFSNRSVLRILGTEVFYHHGIGTGHHEIGIDVVPLDCAPDSKLQRKIQQVMIWIYDAALQIKNGAIIPHHPVMKCIGLLAKKDRLWLCKKIDRWAMRHNRKKTSHVGLLTYTGKNPYTGRSGYDNDLLRREWYEHPIFVDFEDTRFMTISNPEEDLIHRYGPHWAEPYPEEKRVTKHDVKHYTINPEVLKRIEEER